MQENIKKYRKKPVIIEAYKTDKKLVREFIIFLIE